MPVIALELLAVMAVGALAPGSGSVALPIVALMIATLVVSLRAMPLLSSIPAYFLGLIRVSAAHVQPNLYVLVAFAMAGATGSFAAWFASCCQKRLAAQRQSGGPLPAHGRSNAAAVEGYRGRPAGLTGRNQRGRRAEPRHGAGLAQPDAGTAERRDLTAAGSDQGREQAPPPHAGCHSTGRTAMASSGSRWTSRRSATKLSTVPAMRAPALRPFGRQQGIAHEASAGSRGGHSGQ